MDANGEDVNRRWKIIEEQLICLWAYHKKSPVANEFLPFLTEGFTTPIMSLSMFTQICYFLFGIINKEERDRLIKWPVINIQGQVKFRKGVSAIMKGLIEKYPDVNLKRLPESYLIDPSHNQRKILDFVMKLGNLAIVLSANDPHLLEMGLVNENMNASEMEAALTMIRRATVHQEKIIEQNKFPLEKFETIKMEITNKCVALKQENSDLTNKLNKLKKRLMEDGLVHKEEDCNVEYMRNMLNEKVNEMKGITQELKVCGDLSREIVNNLKASGEPISLTAQDLTLNPNEERNFESATSDAYNKLIAMFDSLKCIDSLIDEKEKYFASLEAVRNALLQEKNEIHSFLLKYDQNANNKI